ncbi:MAG: response regulator [Terracidiphilus sp.]|jgi:DNA-binding response OmpR family regulator
MSERKPSLLIVNDEPSMRRRLLQSLTQNGFAARSVADSYSALVEIYHEAPDFLISDLSLPGNSGFEFLRVVRTQFPSIRVIAMSSAYSGDEVTCVASADAFFEKGTSLDALLGILKFLPLPERWARQPFVAPAPVCITSSADRPHDANA